MFTLKSITESLNTYIWFQKQYTATGLHICVRHIDTIERKHKIKYVLKLCTHCKRCLSYLVSLSEEDNFINLKIIKFN